MHMALRHKSDFKGHIKESEAFYLKRCNFYENRTTETAAVSFQTFLNFRSLGVWPRAWAST